MFLWLFRFREWVGFRIFINGGCAVATQGSDLLGHSGNLGLAGLNTKGNCKTASLPRLELAYSSLGPLPFPVMRETGAGFKAGHIAILLGYGIFPLSKIRQFF